VDTMVVLHLSCLADSGVILILVVINWIYVRFKFTFYSVNCNLVNFNFKSA